MTVFSRRTCSLLLASCLLTLGLAPAHAHHSFAMFDTGKKLTLQGTVRELQWTSPHSFLQLLVPQGKLVKEWSLQMNAPVDLYRSGWRPHLLNAGDKVTVVIHPARDRTNSGQLLSVTGPDGKPMPGL